MKRIFSIFMVFVLTVSLSSCGLLNVFMAGNTGSTENAKAFYDKVNESKTLLDLVATDVCAAWKDATRDYTLTTNEINQAIETAKNAHSENVARISELDKEICDLFDKAKDEVRGFSAEYVLKSAMTAYSEYKDSILNANEALDSTGYIGISVSGDSLERALQELYVEL
ncbi:MAG: hypothetical protein IKJ74_04305 [Clostridia bacterium]|nr:hypothetical protein [Clostridia bacterium]